MMAKINNRSNIYTPLPFDLYSALPFTSPYKPNTLAAVPIGNIGSEIKQQKKPNFLPQDLFNKQPIEATKNTAPNTEETISQMLYPGLTLTISKINPPKNISINIPNINQM
ncbi:hypothetical protein [Corallincola spongiicola]|uniref:Uncharacterized protein n=1 Tax=Corallincola spongiicola TaxID=2520508 RepID=A0ABY1WLG4_9GAMM|nr:hypothetical protein [Corallincola spongiicola]TAA41750.1 hypothetical protein EXY25_16040 [Corallincola spongiicola]